MTRLLEKAIAEASKLPEEEQDALAKWILEELQSEKRWAKAFAASPEGLSQLAKEALAEDRDGRTEVLDPDNL